MAELKAALTSFLAYFYFKNVKGLLIWRIALFLSWDTFFLGQTINKETKSSHHIIKVSGAITLVQGTEVIGVVTALSAGVDGHVTFT